MVTCGHVFNHVLNKSSVALPGGGNDCRSKPFSQNYQKLHRHVRAPTYPTRTNNTINTIRCLLAFPLVNCHAGVNEFNTQYPHLFIATACYRCTDHVIMCWKLRDSPKGSGITFAGLLFGLAAAPQKPLQNLGRLLVAQQCRALWIFMTCFFQTPQTHQLSVHCWTVSAYWLKNPKAYTDFGRSIAWHCEDRVSVCDLKSMMMIMMMMMGSWAILLLAASLVHLSNSSSMAHIFSPLSLNPLNCCLRQQICTSHCCQVLQAGIAGTFHGI